MSQATFEQVYRRHVGYVFRLIRRFGVPASELEDATQEVFLTVHRRLVDYDPERGTMRTWLFGIARGVAANRRRSVQRRLRVVPPLETDASDRTPDPEQQTRNRQVLALVGRFLASLPEEQRVVFELVEIEGLRGPEASEALGINVNTAYTRLRAARLAFKRYVARTEGVRGAFHD